MYIKRSLQDPIAFAFTETKEIVFISLRVTMPYKKSKKNLLKRLKFIFFH